MQPKGAHDEPDAEQEEERAKEDTVAEAEENRERRHAGSLFAPGEIRQGDRHDHDEEETKLPRSRRDVRDFLADFVDEMKSSRAAPVGQRLGRGDGGLIADPQQGGERRQEVGEGGGGPTDTLFQLIETENLRARCLRWAATATRRLARGYGRVVEIGHKCRLLRSQNVRGRSEQIAWVFRALSSVG